MKRVLAVLATVMLIVGLAGQAAAYFEEGHLIRVVSDYGQSTEVVTDLGLVTDLIGKNLVVGAGADAWSLSMFAGKTYADLNVQYFAKILSSQDAYTSGPLAGQDNARQWTQFNSGATSVYNLYSTYGTSTVVGETTDPSSSWSKMDKVGLAVGGFTVFIPAKDGDLNLAGLDTAGPFEQALYFYDNPGVAGTGVQAAILQTNLDGSTTISAVPVPAAVWLLGSGLLGLVGIRRKNR